MRKNERFFYDPDKLYRYVVSYYMDDINNWTGTFHARNIEEIAEIIELNACPSEFGLKTYDDIKLCDKNEIQTECIGKHRQETSERKGFIRG